MVIKLLEKTAMVTGGARGIGMAIALALAEAGAQVVITDVRHPDDSIEKDTAAGRVIFKKMDVARQGSINEVVNEIRQIRGEVDILINNAAVMDNYGFMDQQDPDRFENDLKINLTGAFNCARAVWQGMMKKGWGRIVNISSITALGGAFAAPAYGASKAGLLGLTSSMAIEGGGSGITVNAIMPGLIDTEPVRAHGEAAAQSARKRIPAGRLGSPEDVASLAVFLVSEQAGYINGAAIPVTGGIELFKI